MGSGESAERAAFSPQVSAGHYATASYNAKSRYQSFAEQIAETLALKPSSVLEVGIGNGFLTRTLRAAGVTVTAVDFDSSLQPDIVASVESLPLEADSVDVAVCFEVLEHLPFERLPAAMGELARVARNWVFLSVPDARPSLRFELARGWSTRKPLRWQIDGNPLRRPPLHVFDGEHHWEIGKRETPESAVIAAMSIPGLALERHYRLHQHPYHHFFLFRKTRSAL